MCEPDSEALVHLPEIKIDLWIGKNKIMGLD